MEDIGYKIMFYRQKNGYSRQFLSEDICDESTLYRIEKGLQLPRIDILQKFCDRLSIPINYIFSDTDENLTVYKSKIKQLCRESLYQQDFVTMQFHMEEAIEYVKKHSRIEDRVFQRFIGWLNGVLIHKLDHHPKKAEKAFRKLLSNKKVINEVDINIANSLALVLVELDNYDDALYYLKSALTALEESSYIEDKSLYPRVAYNLAYVHFNKSRYNESIDICYKLQYYLKTNHLFYTAGETNHLLGILYKKMGDLKSSQNYFEQAVNIFTFEEKDSPCIMSLHNLADVHFLMENFNKGNEYLQKALEKVSNIDDEEVAEDYRTRIKHTEIQYARKQ